MINIHNFYITQNSKIITQINRTNKRTPSVQYSEHEETLNKSHFIPVFQNQMQQKKSIKNKYILKYEYSRQNNHSSLKWHGKN